MEKDKISVIIPVHNNQNTIRQCLNSVLNQSYKNFEVIIIDNNSTDDTKQIIAEFQKTSPNLISCFEKEQKIGAARNTGEKLASGSLIVMTDSDCLVYSDWLADLTRPLINSESDAVQGFEANLEHNFWADQIQMQNEKRIKYLMKQKDAIGIIDTKNFAISKSALEKIGYSSRKYFYGNDTELSVRFHHQNMKLKFLPEVRVKHLNPSSIRQIIYKYFTRAVWVVYITKDYHHILKQTSFIKQTNQTFWSFVRFFPGLIKTLLLYGPAYTYFDLITGLSWRAGILSGMLTKREKNIG